MKPMRVSLTGPGLALSAALLFGASAPLSKSLLGVIDPWLMAGLLYAGAGIGLLAVLLVRGRGRLRISVARADWPWLAGAILFGGGIGPVLLMIGLAVTDAATSSLLLTLEGVFTALLAWLVFKEHAHARLVWGMGAIALGSALLAWQGSPTWAAGVGPLLIAGASLCWAIDNNLTRKVALNDAVLIAMLKGLCAGAANLALAFLASAAWPSLGPTLAALAVGFAGYGISLVFFVMAMRDLGAGRTGAYFSAAPFVGAALAIVFFGAPLTVGLIVAAGLMALGVWLHLTETHSHLHDHEPMAHSHAHTHDEHHRHAHETDDPVGEPHTHQHEHMAMRHSHAHFPDAHHRHRHKLKSSGAA